MKGWSEEAAVKDAGPFALLSVVRIACARRSFLRCLFCVLAVCWSSLALAQSTDPSLLPEKTFKVRLLPDRLEISTAFTEVFDKERTKSLESGFTTTVLVRAYLYDEANDETPLAISIREVRVVYDLWEEVYLLQITEPGRTQAVSTQEKSRAISLAAAVEDFPLYLDGPLIEGRRYFLAMIVEVNPISQELILEARKWLSRAAGSTAKSEKSSSFFGSFVSIFVNIRPGTAEKTARFRSPSFAVPARKK